MQSKTNDSSAQPERRRYARGKLVGLAYLDIGAENGGIILDVSEGGLGIHSAVPLGSDARVNIRIQHPRFRTGLEMEAEIAWLGPGNQQAGLRFAEMKSEVRVQIQDWVREQLSSTARLQVPAPKPRETSDTPRQQKPFPETRKDKWTNLLGELEAQKRELENRLSNVLPGEKTPAGPTSDEKLPGHVVLRNLLIYSDSEVPVQSIQLSQPGENLNSEPLDGTLPRSAGGDIQAKPDRGSSGSGTGRSQPDHAEVLDWPNRAPQIVPMPVPKNPRMDPVRTTGLVEPPATVAGERADMEPSGVGEESYPKAGKIGAPPRRWVILTVLLVSICVLFFGVGIWVGYPGSRRLIPVARPNTEATIPAAKPDANLNAKGHGAPPSKSDPHKASIRDAATETLAKAKHRMLTLTSGPPIESSTPQPAPVKTSSAISMPTLAAEENSTPAAPSPTLEPTTGTPRVVAGRKLKPTDRFNPCHPSYRVQPEYPLEAKQQRIEGTVKIHQMIGVDGSVQSVRLISGPPLLVPAAMDAAKYWRYLPALLNGEPVADEQDIEIEFRLPR